MALPLTGDESLVRSTVDRDENRRQLLGVAAEITTNDTQEFFRDMLRIIMS